MSSTTGDPTVRWGILGTGWVAHMFTADLRTAGIPVAAVGSRAAESAAAFAREFDIDTAHGSYEQLVADPNVDVVYVSSPHPFHARHAALALNAGKHVLVEKSFTLNGREAREIVALAERNGLIVLEAMWTRFVPHMVRIREIVDAGTIGQVRTLIADHNQKLPTDPEHRINNPALGGGALLDLGVYPVSFADALFGAPSTITARGIMTATGVDRQCAMVFDYADGQQAVLQCALDTPGPNTASILGTEGWIAIDPVWHDAATFTVYDADEHLIERFDTPVAGRGMQYQAFEVQRLADAGETVSSVMSPASSIRVMDAMDEVRRQLGLRYPGE